MKFALIATVLVGLVACSPNPQAGVHVDDGDNSDIDADSPRFDGANSERTLDVVASEDASAIDIHDGNSISSDSTVNPPLDAANDGSEDGEDTGLLDVFADGESKSDTVALDTSATDIIAYPDYAQYVYKPWDIGSVQPVGNATSTNAGWLSVNPKHGFLDPLPNWSQVTLTTTATVTSCQWQASPPDVCKLWDPNPAVTGVIKTGGGLCTVQCRNSIDQVLASVVLKAPWQTVIYVAGGSGKTSTVRNIDRFVSARGVWQEALATLPEKRGGPALGVYDQRLYILGGRTNGSISEQIDDPANFPWSCPEVIESMGGTDWGCRSIRVLDLGTGLTYNSKTELPFARDGIGVRVGPNLHIYPLLQSFQAKPMKANGDHIVQVFNMATESFASSLLHKSALNGATFNFGVPWEEGRLLRASHLTKKTGALLAFDHTTLGLSELKIATKSFPCALLAPEYAPRGLIPLPGPHPGFFARFLILEAGGTCSTSLPYVTRGTSNQKSYLSRWFRWRNGKWTVVTGKLALHKESIVYDRVFVTPEGTWVIGTDKTWRMKGIDGDFDEFPPMPHPRGGVTVDWR